MTQFMSGRIAREVEARLKRLTQPVSLLYFARAGENAAQLAVLEEVAALSARLALEVFDLDADRSQALRYAVDKAPATAVLGYRDYGIRFYGLTAGYQFASLLEAIVMAAAGRSGLAPEIEAAAEGIRGPLHLEILVSLRCPYSARLVHRAHQLAVASRNVRADMVDAAAFPDLLDGYRTDGLPAVVVNGRPIAAAEAAAGGNWVMRLLDDRAPETFAVAYGAARQAEEWNSPQSLTGALWLEPVLPQRVPARGLRMRRSGMALRPLAGSRPGTVAPAPAAPTARGGWR